MNKYNIIWSLLYSQWLSIAGTHISNVRFLEITLDIHTEETFMSIETVLSKCCPSWLAFDGHQALQVRPNSALSPMPSIEKCLVNIAVTIFIDVNITRQTFVCLPWDWEMSSFAEWVCNGRKPQKSQSCSRNLLICQPGYFLKYPWAESCCVVNAVQELTSCSWQSAHGWCAQGHGVCILGCILCRYPPRCHEENFL